MTTTQERFSEAKAKMRAAQEEARAVVREVFKEGAAELFAAHPRLDSFGWTQYTPYFNDGDECVFGVHIDEPDFNGENSYDLGTIHKTKYEMVGGKYENVTNPDYDPELGNAFEAVREFLATFDEPDYRELFGDHKKVTVRRDGALDIDDYEHD
jgi:hypothetical protein